MKGARWFLSAAVLASLTVGCVGWFTGLRHTVHGVLLTLGAVAFLPFLLIAIGIALPLAGILIATLGALTGTGADVDVIGGGEVAEAGVKLLPRYYRFLARIRHPGILGGVLGVLLGTLGLWAILAVVIVPHEAETVRILSESARHIEAHDQEHGKYPPVNVGDGLSIPGGDASVNDDFGRPLIYRTKGAWKLRSYSLTSLGYDGEPSGDDLCVAGGTKAALAIEQLKELIRPVGGEDTDFGDRFAAISSLRCGDD